MQDYRIAENNRVRAVPQKENVAFFWRPWIFEKRELLRKPACDFFVSKKNKNCANLLNKRGEGGLSL